MNRFYFLNDKYLLHFNHNNKRYGLEGFQSEGCGHHNTLAPICVCPLLFDHKTNACSGKCWKTEARNFGFSKFPYAKKLPFIKKTLQNKCFSFNIPMGGGREGEKKMETVCRESSKSLSPSNDLLYKIRELRI